MKNVGVKKIFTILLLGALLLPVITGVNKIAHYAIDFREYKAQCKNRDNIEITCNGLCILGSELASDSKETDPTAPLVPTIENLIPLFVTQNDRLESIQSFVTISKKTIPSFYKDLASQSFINELIKPPTLV
ncbi:MAG: hypothetical protein ACK4KT_10005 [Thermaurantimonas sp.]